MSAEITRIDRYTIKVNGFQVRATEDQEHAIRAMTSEQIADFLKVMGADR